MSIQFLEHYGVVISGGAVDRAATEALRKSLRTG